jgi:hypothetical protein
VSSAKYNLPCANAHKIPLGRDWLLALLTFMLALLTSMQTLLMFALPFCSVFRRVFRVIKVCFKIPVQS